MLFKDDDNRNRLRLRPRLNIIHSNNNINEGEQINRNINNVIDSENNILNNNQNSNNGNRERRNDNIIIRNNMNISNRNNNRNNNQNSNNANRERRNDNIVIRNNMNISYRNNNSSEEDSLNLSQRLCICFIFVGVNTIIVGCNKKNSFYILLGVFQFLLVSACLLIMIFIECIYVLLCWYYIALMILLYLISLYFAIFHGNCSFYKEQYENFKEIETAIIVIFMNIICPGTGSFLFGLSRFCEFKEQANRNIKKCSWYNWKYLLSGIITMIGFIIFILFFIASEIYVYIIFGILYCIPLYTGIRLYIEKC